MARRLRFGAVAIAVFAFAFAPTSPAQAVTHDMVYVTNPPIDVSAFGDSVSRPKCPTGTTATGGGIAIVAGSLDTMVGDDRPDDRAADPDTRPDDGWYASARDLSGDSFLDGAEATVACSLTGVFKYRTSEVVNLTGHTQGHAEAYCPSGSRAVSGGMSGQKAGGEGLSSSLPIDTSRDADSLPDDGWQVWGTNETGVQLPLVAHVVCATEARSSYVYASGSPVAVLNDDQGQAYVTCPAGTSVVGGGGYITGTHPSIELAATYPSDDLSDANSAPDDVWIVRANNESSISQNLTAWVVCRS